MHSPVGDGCTCRLGVRCEKVGKHPRTQNGFKDASTDRDVIDRWWSKWPSANIGIRTGDGLVVIDIDGSDGEESITPFDIPATVEAKTSRGRHLYFQGDFHSP